MQIRLGNYASETDAALSAGKSNRAML